MALAKVLTVSDGVVAGTRDDRSGAVAEEVLVAAGFEVVERRQWNRATAVRPIVRRAIRSR